MADLPQMAGESAASCQRHLAVPVASPFPPVEKSRPILDLLSSPKDILDVD